MSGQPTPKTVDAKVERPGASNSTSPAPRRPKKRKRKKYRSPAAVFAIAVARIAILGYAAILVTLVMMESRLVYPGAYMADAVSLDRTGAGSPIESVEYVSTDDVVLTGRLIDRPDREDVVLFFHGNGTKANWLDPWLIQLADAFDASAMVAEYRGFSDDVTPTEKGILADCEAARDYLCERFGKRPDELILYGRSLGGGCAVAVASRGGAKALVLERTFDRMVNVAAEKYPFVPVRLLMRNRYDSVAKLTVYDGPLVVIHGASDNIIPMHHGRRLFDTAGNSPKQWIGVESMGHNDPLPVATLQEIVAAVREATAVPEESS